MKHFFETLPQQFRFIGVDADGTASAYTEAPRWDGESWVPTSQTGAVKALGTGKPGEFSLFKGTQCGRNNDEMPQLSQDITARQHYAFELFKIAAAEGQYGSGEEIEAVARRSYAIADIFLAVGAK